MTKREKLVETAIEAAKKEAGDIYCDYNANIAYAMVDAILAAQDSTAC